MDLYFSALDELIQVIYQGSAKFVLLSRVDHTSWTVHLGLSGLEGRWWRGKWTDENVKAITGGPKPTEDMLEAFGERLANTIVTTDLMIGNWSPERGVQINLTLGLSTTKPMRIDLTELLSSDAAAFATKEFLSIALEAQSRKCRLNPPTFGLPPPEPSYLANVSTLSSLNKDNDENRATAEYSVEPVSASATKFSETLHESLKTSQDNSDKISTKQLDAGPESKPVSTQPARKSAAQQRARGPGIPNKRARKVKAMEFGSDDE